MPRNERWNGRTFERRVELQFQLRTDGLHDLSPAVIQSEGIEDHIPQGALAFVALLFLVARPAAVWIGLLGATTISRDQRILISWFGIRGVGSMFYLVYAINHGLPLALAQHLIAITLTTVAASIVLHGISVTPLMSLYARRKASARRIGDSRRV